MTCGRSIVLSLTLVALAGCGSVYGADHYVTGTIHAEHLGEVQIFMHDETPPATESLEEIALVRAAGYGGGLRENEVWDRLRQEAARLGADTIVRVHRDQSDVDLVLVGVAARRR